MLSVQRQWHLVFTLLHPLAYFLHFPTASLPVSPLFPAFSVAGVCYRTSPPRPRSYSSPDAIEGPPWGSPAWDKQVLYSAARSKPSGIVVLVTGAAGFVGSHVSLALRERGDGVVGLDNFNSYYPVALKRARQARLEERGM